MSRGPTGFGPAAAAMTRSRRSTAQSCGTSPKRRWVLDADLAAAFDRIAHDHILTMLGTFPARGMVRAMAEGGRGRERSAAPHRGGNSSRRGGQPRAAERRPARDGAGRRGSLPHHRQGCRLDGRGLAGADQVRRRSRRLMPLPGRGARGQGQARQLAGAQGSCPSTRTRRASSPSMRASTSWDSTSAAMATSC